MKLTSEMRHYVVKLDSVGNSTPVDFVDGRRFTRDWSEAIQRAGHLGCMFEVVSERENICDYEPGDPIEIRRKSTAPEEFIVNGTRGIVADPAYSNPSGYLRVSVGGSDPVLVHPENVSLKVCD